MGSSGRLVNVVSPRKPSLPLSSRSTLPAGVIVKPRSRMRASIMASTRAMRASMDMPRVLASLARRSVSLSRGRMLLRDALLPFVVVLDACAWSVGVGLLRFCRASAAVWSSEKKHRLPLSMQRWHGLSPEHYGMLSMGACNTHELSKWDVKNRSKSMRARAGYGC